MAQLYPSFSKGLAPFFGGNWGEYSDFLTFKGGLNPVTGGLWLSDIAHHHLALSVLFIIAGHMYRTNWGIGHNMKEILEYWLAYSYAERGDDQTAKKMWQSIATNRD